MKANQTTKPPRANLASWAWGAANEASGEAKAAYLLRAHVLQQLSALLVAHHLSMMVVKGAALAATHYAIPWARPMADIDLLVRANDLTRSRQMLENAGWHCISPSDRPLTESALEVTFLPPGDHGRVAVEMHLGLDKVVLRHLDTDALFGRAVNLTDYPGLMAPANEDHVLLVALHLAADEFRHRTGFVDLEMLLSSGIDSRELVERAHEWRAETPLYVAFQALESLRPGLVSHETMAALKPALVESMLLSTSFRIGRWPVARSQTTLGWRWLAKQTLLRDDKATWLTGLGRYAVLRALERVRSAI